MQRRAFAHLALLAGAAVVLAGCGGLGDVFGNKKSSPDEFAVVTKAPLVIPPDFNLRPPAPGAAPANQVEPTDAARSALYGADPAAVAASMPATTSPGERYLLASAGAQNAAPGIRQTIAADNANLRTADQGFASNVMFWTPSSATPAGTPVDADAEARRIEAARAAGTSAAPPPPAAAPAAAPPTSPPPSTSSDDNSDSGGWLGGLWPF